MLDMYCCRVDISCSSLAMRFISSFRVLAVFSRLPFSFSSLCSRISMASSTDMYTPMFAPTFTRIFSPTVPFTWMNTPDPSEVKPSSFFMSLFLMFFRASFVMINSSSWFLWTSYTSWYALTVCWRLTYLAIFS